MKKLLIFFILLFGSLNFSVAQTYSWAITDTSLQSDHGAHSALARDASGNLIIAYAPLPDVAYADFIAIIKYDSNHNVIWTQKISALAIASIDIGLCTDALGNVYVTSYFVDDLFFNSTLCASVSGGNMFLIKIDATGTFQWVRNSTGGQVSAFSLSSDAENNIYVGGGINGDAYFNSIHLSSPNVYSYIAKYSPNGDFLWVKGTSANGLPKIKTDSSGNTYITGAFLDTVQFDNFILIPYGFYDIYLAKIDPSGNWLWAKQAGGIYDDHPTDFDIDSQNNLYITGYLESKHAKFGTITLPDATGDSYFLAKYDSGGNALWALHGGSPNGYGYTVCADNLGNVYLSRASAFISKYDNAGNFLWFQYKGTADNQDMISDNEGNIYSVGYFNSTVTFNNFTFTNNDPNKYQMFVAQLADVSTSVNEHDNHFNDLSIYPNPTDRLININYASETPFNKGALRISNNLGQNVYSESINETSATFTHSIDLGSLPKGIYFLELRSSDSKEQKAQFKKVVLQ